MKRPAGVALAFLALLALLARPIFEGQSQWNFGQYGDDGVYFVTAKAIASGQGYREPSLPGHPYAVKYPPLYPIYLSLAWLIQPKFPENLHVAAAMQALLIPCMLAMLLALLRQAGLSWVRSFWVASVTLFTPTMMLVDVLLFSEILFMCFLFAALIAVERSVKAGEDRARWIALAGGVLAGLAYLSRTAALPMLAAAPAFYFLRKRNRLSVYFLAAAIPVALSWNLFTLTHGGASASGPNAGYLTEYINIIRVTGFWANFWKQLGAVSSSIADMLIPGFVAAMAGLPLFYIVPAAALSGNWRRIQRDGWSVYALFAVPYLVMIMLWWFDGVARFLLPVWPLLALGVAEEIAHISGMVEARTKSQAPRWILIAAGFLLVLRTNLVSQRQTLAYLADEHSQRLKDLPAFSWISEQLRSGRLNPDDTVALSWKDTTTYLYTGMETSRGVFVRTLPLPEREKATSSGLESLPPPYKRGLLVLLQSDLSADLQASTKNPLQETAESLPESKLEFRSPGALIYSFRLRR